MMIQLRHVPDQIHRRLKSRAALEGLSLSDFLLKEVEKIAALPTHEEMAQRLAMREPVTLSVTPTEMLRMERDGR